MEDEVRYPIGKFQFREPTPALRRELLAQFTQAPAQLREAVRGLDRERLATPYREGGWTVAQVVHHIVESDVNAYPRLKLALTEKNPTILVAKQALWAEIADAQSLSIESSLDLFDAIRRRWAEAWESVKVEDFSRPFVHPVYGPLTIDHLLQQYTWHPRHHTAQVTGLRARRGW